MPPGPVARDQGRELWWPELVVCTQSAAGACVVVRAGCRHTHSGEGQGQQGLGPTVGILSAMGVLLSACPSTATGSYLGPCIAVEASEKSWLGRMWVQSYRGPVCQYALHDWRVSPWARAWQWRPVMEIRPEECWYTAGGASSECAHRSGVSCRSLG